MLLIAKITGGGLLGYGLLLAVGFFAIRYGFTNTKGKVDGNDSVFSRSAKELSRIEGEAKSHSFPLAGLLSGGSQEDSGAVSDLRAKNICRLDELNGLPYSNASGIYSAYQETGSDPLIAKMLLAVDLRFQGNEDYARKMAECDDPSIASQRVLGAMSVANGAGQSNVFTWANAEEWKTIEASVVKDKDKIDQAAAAAGIEPRLIVSSLIVEQLRLYYSDRELFKRVFEPLKILCNATQISWGVMGIKEKAAIDTENHLKDPSSPYYLGSDKEHLLDFSTDDAAKERFDRLTNDKDHYYAYLYGAVYLKEMMSQWQAAGYDIRYRPEIVATLFNVGFPQSSPKADPKVGGSKITIGDREYSFGSLAYEFYYSGELSDQFPYVVN